MAYQEPKKRSIRLDDDVYEALRSLAESPNKFLRRVLSAGGVFEPEHRLVDIAPEGLSGREARTVRGGTGKLLNLHRGRKPLLKPKDGKK